MTDCMVVEEENVSRERIDTKSRTRIYERTSRQAYIDPAEYTQVITNSNV